MKAPILKFENDKFVIEGNFNFQPSIITYCPHNSIIKPIRKICFDWCVEIPQQIGFDENVFIEMFGEKLKQDFIKFLKNKRTT